MEILNTIENKDGTVTLELDMTEEENSMLVEYAVIRLLKKYIKSQKKGR